MWYKMEKEATEKEKILRMRRRVAGIKTAVLAVAATLMLVTAGCGQDVVRKHI